jgi:DNA polymerase I
MEEINTLLIFDGHNVALRAYHALSKQTELLKNKEGQGTWGIYGFFTTLVHFVNRYNPKYVAITFDWGQSEQRLAIFEGYKANRKFNNPDEVSKRQESRRQVDVLIRLLEKFNIKVLREPNVEADDIIAKLISLHDGKVVVVSGDHDLRQLITDKVIVVKPSIGIKAEDIFDYQKVIEKYGIEPNRLPEVWALTGDTSDNIPGVPGVGEKTAVEYLKKYGTLENVLASEEKKLKGNRSTVEMAYKIIYLDGSYCNIDIPDLTFNPINPGEIGADLVLEFLEELNFNSIKLKWITGTLWRGNEISVGKLFKTLKDYKNEDWTN